MAQHQQYYQIVTQDQIIQTVSLEDLQRYYPNLCVESNTGVQYVINNQDDAATQFQSQQVLVSTDQQIVLNTEDANQQIIVEQAQVNYQQPTQQYSIQEEVVTEFTQQNETQPQLQPQQQQPQQQQVFYSPPKQQIIQQVPAGQMVAQIEQRQMVIQQTRITNHINQRQIVPQMELEDDDDKQQVLVDGRYMTMKQFKQEYSPNRTEIQQTVAVQEIQSPPPKPPPKPRAPRRNANPRGSRANRGGGRANQNNQLHNQNHVNDASIQKPFQQITNSTTPKQIQTYPNRTLNQIKSPQILQRATLQQQQQQQQLHMQPLQQIMQPQIPQTIQQTSNIQQHVVSQQQRQITPQNLQPHLQQQQQQHIQAHLQQQPQQLQAQYQQANRVQPLIPLSPHVPNGHVQNNAYSPSSNHSQNQNQYLDDSSNLSDDYKDSARMLVCLENGEQRLITFTLPKESCTVQDLLEQVGVPFNADTKIECISNPGSEIDYIVNVGAVNSSTFPMETQQVLSVENVSEPQECIVSPAGKIVPISEMQNMEKVEEPPKPKSPEKPPEPPKEVPKFIPGCLAVCNHCGYLSEDFNRCQRCKTKLREDVKCISNKLEEKDKKPNTPKVAAKVTTPNARPLKITLSTNPKPTPPRSLKGKRTKPADVEPVVLTLSSDDEDSSPKSTTANSSLPLKLLDTNVTLSVIQKEPVINENCDIELDLKLFEEDGVNGGTGETRTTADILTTNLPCRTVRIGSYRFVPKEEVLITTSGVTILAPSLNDTSEICKIFIPMTYIIKVLYSFNKSLPVLFFYVTPSVASHVRSQLSMKDGSDLYFDPLAKEEPQKRITLLPDVVNEETKNKIKEIYNTTKEYNMLEELSPKEANDVLIRTCPKEASSQKSQPQSVNTSFSEMRQLVIYPPGKGGIAISNEDYLCLAQDQFLNDVIIDFYLKYLMTDVLDPPMQEKVYIFSSFFYKRLTTKPAKGLKRTNSYEADPNLSAAEKRHFRVKKWTKNVNIFEKDFVIIPINENMHWFLAIICFPGLDGCRSMNDTSKVIKEPTKEKKKANTSITIGNTTITTVKTSDEKKVSDKPIKCDDDELSDRDEAEGDESELEESDVDTDVSEEKKPSVPEPVKQPCILIFDSLAGAGRSRVVATLRDYLTCEYKAKSKGTKTFTKDNIKGACPKVPQQMNFTDCGLYVLQYVESFFKNPITDYRIPIKQLKSWFEEIVVTKKREDISNLIRDLMVENNKNPNILPDISFPTLNGELVNNMDPNFSENEDDEDEEDSGEQVEEFQSSTQSTEKMDDSLGQLQTYNSDSGSESPVTSTESSPNSSKTKCSTTSSSSTPATTTFNVTTVSSPIKPDTNSEVRKSNRESTMSYLKSKRITRHKNSDTNEVKKLKLDE